MVAEVVSMADTANEVTRLLVEHDVRSDPRAMQTLFGLVYEDLHQLADRCLRRERSGHTLQPTALVHEAYLRLVHQRHQTFANERQFLGVAAMAMRRILIHHAEKRSAQKRGAARERVTLFEAASVMEERAPDLLALDEALTRLEAIDPAKCRIVELRFFAGLSVEETARVLDCSTRTVERDWRLAKAWLRLHLEDDGGAREPAEP
jgi:RNA polymerase sigma factor (TIGR02999 family)